MAPSGFLRRTLASWAAPDYQLHAPLTIQSQPTSPGEPLVVELYEISQPDRLGIQVSNVDYAVIRNNGYPLSTLSIP